MGEILLSYDDGGGAEVGLFVVVLDEDMVLCRSPGMSCSKNQHMLEQLKAKIHTFFVREPIAHPANAPAAPVAELTRSFGPAVPDKMRL